MIIFCLVSPRSPRFKPTLVALSVLLGVLLAAGGLLAYHATAGDETIQVALTDANYVPRSPIYPTTSYSPGPPPAPAQPSPEVPPPPSTSTTTPAPSTSKTTSKPPTSAKSTPPASAPDSSASGQILALVNRQRADNGCGALTLNGSLNNAAENFAEDMSEKNYFSHVSPDGTTFDQRIKAAGYPSPAAENIAKGSTTPAQTMDMWMNSAGHRANILNCSYKKLGVGLDTSGWYWVQDFGF